MIQAHNRRMGKPRLFVGSSVEGLSIAYAVARNLDPHDAEVKVWPQGVFGIATYALDSLLEALKVHDFGAFVFSPDDITVMRRQKHKTVRDNVLFELGLFMGRLGLGRAFIIAPTGTPLHLPSDLAGLMPATYEPGRARTDAVGALGIACDQIREAIRFQSGIHTKRSEVSSVAPPIEKRSSFSAISRRKANRAPGRRIALHKPEST
jgi:predicted nucleotide-binding protein